MKIKRSDFLKLMSVTAASAVLAGCGSSVVEKAAQSTANSQASSGSAPAAELDLSENIALKINYAAGNKSRTITYNQESPLNLPDGTNVTAGMLKPVWSHLQQVLNVTVTDVTTQDQKATEMIDTASTTNFAEANIFGGNSIADDLMYYGTEGKFVNLSQMMDQGYLPNFQNYLDENPDVRRAITAYDGNIYHIPYIAELNNFARSFCARQSWVVMLLDVDDAAYDTDTELTCYYKGFYAGANARYGANGGSVSPMEGVTITKKTDQNIVELQNALSVKNGETLTRTFVQYIKDNYDYASPSELFLGEKAAYDIDELVALMRCIKANPGYLTDGRADTVWPIMGYSLPRSAIYCTIFSIIIAAISPETRMGPRKLLQTLMDGVRQAANIAIPTAACGIMIGIVVNSGVAVKIAKLIGTSGEGSLFIALLIAALGCLLLGMALPTVAAYLIAVTLFASAIQGLGISALVTNMFIFYFGVVAQITPPVCLASFTAAGIAGASAWKTGWKAFSFAITAFIVPFAFVYRPAILLEGTMVEIIIAYCIVIAATYLLACGIAGYLFRPLKMWERIACYVVAFIFILPSSMSDIIGIAGCVLIMAYCFMTGKKNANKAQPA